MTRPLFHGEHGRERLHVDRVGSVQLSPMIIFLVDQMWVK
jgi:hypothetical protein